MKILMFVLIYVFSIGCFAEKSDSPIKELKSVTVECKVSTKKPIPKQVLMGTDVVDKTQFDKVGASNGVFSSDMGGAIITVEIGDQLLKRSYAEPGMEKLVKNYSGLCMRNNIIDGDNVRAVFVTNGLLLWEQKPGNAMVPQDMWILLQRK